MENGEEIEGAKGEGEVCAEISQRAGANRLVVRRWYVGEGWREDGKIKAR